QPGQQGQGEGPPGRLPGEPPQDDPRVSVHEGTAGRPRRRVVVDAGPLDLGTVPLGRRVVEGEQKPSSPGQQRLQYVVGQASGQEVGPPPGGGDGGVRRAELLRDAGGPDPTCNRPATGS